MTQVFLGGSRKVSRLNEVIRLRLSEIVRREMAILIGDANGADRALQAQLASWSYPHVTVYHVGEAPRNNEGSWPTRRIRTPRGAKGFDFYSAKDQAMASDAECGLMLWDGNSRGTLANVERLVKAGKPVALYVSTNREFTNIRSVGDLKALTGEPPITTEVADQAVRGEAQVSFEFL